MVVLALFAGLLAGAASLGGSRTSTLVVLRSAGVVLARFPTTRYFHNGAVDSQALATVVGQALPTRAPVAVGSARIVYGYDSAAVLTRLAARGSRGGTIDVPRIPTSASVAAAPVQQALQNDCEATALQILLSTVGQAVDQQVLQAELPRSGPLDPIQSGANTVWGDPDLGFVGRADGSGAAGGFGVYQGPVQRLAERHGVSLVDLSDSAPASVYDRVLHGHAVMVWVGLSDGPYGSWQSPAGKQIRVNFGEHSVVLSGVTAATVTVVNPLTGTIDHWSKGQFETMWARLGDRALST